jgi:hypothetical protein
VSDDQWRSRLTKPDGDLKLKTNILTIAVGAIVAFVLLAAPVQAGPKGKKLNFGGGLGTFTAVPTKGYKSKKKRKSVSRRKSTSKAAAIRRAKLRKAAAAKKRRLIAARKAKIAAEKKKAKLAAIRKAKAERNAARRAKYNADNSDKDLDEDKSETGNAEKDRVIDDVEISEEIDEKTLAEASVDEVPEAEQTRDQAISCKKYIPSAGLTISVPCEGQ